MKERFEPAEDNSTPYLFSRSEALPLFFILSCMLTISTLDRWSYYNKLEAQKAHESHLVRGQHELSDRVASSVSIPQLTNSYCPIKK